MRRQVRTGGWCRGGWKSLTPSPCQGATSPPSNKVTTSVKSSRKQQRSHAAHRALRCPGRIQPADYLAFGLYKLKAKEQKEFVSDSVHWPIHDHCADLEWSPRTTDKWETANILGDAGLPTIPVVAVIDGSETQYGETPTIRSGQDLAKFLTGARFPLFGKPKNLLGSLGALRIEGVDGDLLTLGDGMAVSCDEFVNELIGGVAYILQEVVENHEALGAMSTALATVRTMNFVTPGSVRLAAAVLKIPVRGNVADNFWRDGNLLADVDPDSGVIARAVSGTGPRQVSHTVHPDTGAELVGMELPMWGELVELNQRTAELFSAISYQSLDLAITDNGPVVVEVNSGGSFELPQIASGRGFLTRENRAFFESQGVNFKKLGR